MHGSVEKLNPKKEYEVRPKPKATSRGKGRRGTRGHHHPTSTGKLSTGVRLVREGEREA